MSDRTLSRLVASTTLLTLDHKRVFFLALPFLVPDYDFVDARFERSQTDSCSARAPSDMDKSWSSYCSRSSLTWLRGAEFDFLYTVTPCNMHGLPEVLRRRSWEINYLRV